MVFRRFRHIIIFTPLIFLRFIVHTAFHFQAFLVFIASFDAK